MLTLFALAARAADKDDLQVHEWGVFTIFNDVKYANANRKAEWARLPDAFYRQFPTQRLKWAPAAWDKPVIYFYTARPVLDVEVTVKFAGGGAPVVWWPCAARPVNSTSTPASDQPLPRFDSLTWRARLGAAALAPSEPLDGSWLADARVKDAAPVTVSASLPHGSRPWENRSSETEQFIFYDGLVPAPDYLRCPAGDEMSFTLRNAAKFDIEHLWLIDRRDATTRAVATSIKSGEERKAAFKPVETRAVIADVRAALVAAGLFEAEADAMLKVWHKGFFENGGVVAFYLLPQGEYDRMLPLTITPQPANPRARVGVAFHPNFEADPVIDRRVRDLIQRLDDGDYKSREAAKAALIDIGPVAMRYLRDAAEKTDSEEIRRLSKRVLDAIDPSEWLKP
jgi:hypothetical protein